MKTLHLAGAVLAALLSAGAATAQTCSVDCNAEHSACTRSGKDYGTCMGVWRQCKTSCLTPARASTSAPKATPAVVRR